MASVSASDVWAVGSASNAAGNAQPLAEHRDGAAWRIVPTPTVVTGTLSGVAAISSADVWAGGGFLLSSRGNTAQFEHWNGRRWAVVPSPAPGPRNSHLDGVTAVNASDVWAAGDFQKASGVFQALTEHWNGTAWRIVASPSGAGPEAGLLAVAAVSTSEGWAVGDTGGGTLIERWNGTSLAVVPSPAPAGTLVNPLSGAAVVSDSDIWAVGQSQNGTTGIPQTLIEQWNGTSWSIVPSPAPGTASLLSGASADPASGQAWAVGNLRAASGATQTLTEFNP